MVNKEKFHNMAIEEMKKAIEELKAQGNDEQAILGAFYRMFQDEKLTLDELDGVVNLLGYHLTEEFKSMSSEDQKTKGFERTDEPAEGVSEKEVEDAKETDDDSDDSDSDDSDSDSGEKEDKDDTEEEEEKRAMKLFGQDK